VKSARPEVGQIIGGFQLVEQLKPGGTASLWRVTRDDLPLPLLMKIPFMRGGVSPLAIVGFETESMILPRLSGPHVPRFIAAGDFSEPFIVMEFVTGVPLIVRLSQTPLGPAEVAEIGAKIAVAMHDLHRQHVLHLDLKPSNIIMRESNGAALIDFGLAHHDQLPDLVSAEIAGPIGTGAYIAPEQLLGVRTDPRSDVFALGVILYFLATGERPFGEPTSVREWRRRLWRDPYPPRRWNAKIPPVLQEVILRCLEVDPSARPATGAEVAFALRNPECVLLTERSIRARRDPLFKVVGRWTRARKEHFPADRPALATQLARAPIILVGIDLSAPHEALAGALATEVKRLIEVRPGARIACVNVIKGSILRIDPSETPDGRSLHLQRLIELKHWARLLPLPPDRLSLHVVEAVDPAAALIDFARTNCADHIVVGARASSGLRRYLGSVSAQIVAEASCTVTVVRTAAA
jgi:nucleotide-binding universal stress UspA family protein